MTSYIYSPTGVQVYIHILTMIKYDLRVGQKIASTGIFIVIKEDSTKNYNNQ